MSVYDFNHITYQQQSRQQTNSYANEGSHGQQYQHQDNSHLPLQRYQSTAGENEYSSRYHSSAPTTSVNSNQPDMSRPTSKTAMLVRQRRAMMEHLSCSICRGYLIDATIVNECMHSFCKSCLVKYLNNHDTCPKCNTFVQRNDPSSIKPDKVLQSIVYKLKPGLYDDEMKKRRDFYRRIYGDSQNSSDGSDDSSSSSLNGLDPKLSGEQCGIIPHPKPFYKLTDNIDLSIEPQTKGNSIVYFDNKRQSIITRFTGNIQNHKQQQLIKDIFSAVDSKQFKTYLRCPARLTVAQLKKFIAAKFNVCRDDTIHLLYINETLNDDYSLIDIAYIYDWRGSEHMCFYYIIERDYSHITLQLESNTKTRQNAATSTQTIKRVCIDPKPRYYNEQSGSSETSNNTNRLTRSSQAPRQPILNGKSNGQGIQKAMRSQTNGGMANRELALAGQQRTTSQTPTCRSAINELSRTKGNEPTETRASRKLTAESTQSLTLANPVPKINLSSGSTNKNTGNNLLDTRTGKNFQPSTSSAVANQSSLVTLASLIEARNNHVMAVSTTSSTAATITGSYESLTSAAPNKNTANADIRNRQSGTPQLAFSFVTERGITIVRKVNSDSALTSTTTATTNSSSLPNRQLSNSNTPTRGSLPALMAASSQQLHTSGNIGPMRGGNSLSSTPTNNQNNLNTSNNTNNNQSFAGAPGGGSGSNISNGHESSSSARHLAKVKPVYKTLVDPTKVKTPNYRKMGYTARH